MAKAKYEYWTSEEGLLLLGSWARNGLTDEQIASNIGISRSTLNEWKKKYSDISDTLKKRKEVVDVQVENALLKKALGYTVTVNKPIKVKETIYENGRKVSEKEKIELVEEEVHIPADTTAQIFWLKNRKPEVWREKQSVDLSGNITTETAKLDDIIDQLNGDE